LLVLSLGLSAYTAYYISDLASVKQKVAGIEDAIKKLEITVSPEAAELAAIPDPPPGHIAIKFTFSRFVRLEGVITSVHEVPEGVEHWTTTSYKAGEPVKIAGRELPGGVLFIKPGEEKLVTFVFRSTVPKDQHYYVVPHTFKPAEVLTGINLMCLCTGTVYHLPAYGAFARVIKVIVDPSVKPGIKVVAEHPVVSPVHEH